MKRLGWILGMSFLAAASAVACASKDDGGADDVDAGNGTGIEPYQPNGNGERMSEADACDRMTGALDGRASDLGCIVTHPPCPQYLRQSTSGACYDYDEGTIASCVDFIGKYQSCDDFQKRPCIVTYFADSVCEESDAGADASDEDADLDDASPDEDGSDGS